MKTLGKLKKTERGFELIEFRDRYNEPCSLQQSSIATEDCIWLGYDHPLPEVLNGVRPKPRMHLNQRQVKALVRHLSAWLETGSFSVRS